MKRTVLARILPILALALSLVPAPAGAALNAYLELSGETQGKIAGSSSHEGREGLIEIYGFSHEVVSPRDAASGLPTGKRQHRPVVVTVAVDSASSALHSALNDDENITEWRIDFWRPSRSGQEQNYYTVVLTNAHIDAIRTEMVPTETGHDVRAHIAFDYEEIETHSWGEGADADSVSSQDAIGPSQVIKLSD